ncbi:MAG: hypothetical protein ACLQPD_28210 [Desulfomonilaceae bacterium]
MTTDDNRTGILKDLLAKHRRDPRFLKRILGDLKGMDVKPARAAEWTTANLRFFLTTHFPNEMAEIAKSREGQPRQAKAEIPKPARTQKMKKVPQKEPPKPSVRKEIVPLPSQEPPFREDIKKTKPGSYRIPQELYELVDEKVKRDKRRTGGSVASLVRILLWLYVGAPEEFLEPEYKPE